MCAQQNDTEHDGRDWIEMRADIPFRLAKRELLARFERSYVCSLLVRHRGNISAIARESELSRTHVRNLIEKYDLHHDLIVDK